MNDDSLFERDIADDVLTPQRVAALCAIYQKIVDTFDDNGVLAHADELADRLHATLKACFLLLVRVELAELFGAQEFCNDIARQSLAIADRGKEIVGPAQTIFVGNALQYGFVT